jgi:archaellum biogenesis ATPase FlaH
MGSTVGFGVIKSIIENSVPLSQLVEIGVTEEYFRGDEKKAFNFLKEYFNRYSTHPSLATIAVEIEQPTCFQALPNETSEYWLHKIKQRHRFSISQQGIKRIENLLERAHITDAVDAFGDIYSGLRATYTESRAIDLRDAERDVLNKHELLQQGGQLPGIPFGFPYIDNVSGGAQRGDSIVIAGVTGSGKTYLSLRIALSAWYAGYNILFLCTEMPIHQVARRLLAMEANFDARNLKLGRLSYFAVQKALGILETPVTVDLEGQTNFFKILPGGLYSRLEDVQLITRELRPELLVIDGASLVRMPKFRGSRWERMIEVMESTKELAMSEDIATISTYHFGKQYVGTVEGVYGGLAMSQLASILYSFEFERQEDRDSPNPVQYRILKLLKGRDGESGAIRVQYNMLRSSIVQDRVLSGYDPTHNEENETFEDANPYEEI